MQTANEPSEMEMGTLVSKLGEYERWSRIRPVTQNGSCRSNKKTAFQRGIEAKMAR
jgi:hypothetical protein